MTATATGTGRRMTIWATRNQRPLPGAGAAEWRRLRAFTRSPSRASIAGVAKSAAAAASSATVAAPAPIEYRKRCGSTIIAAAAAATVRPLKKIVRPAVSTVRLCASQPGPARASSSR